MSALDTPTQAPLSRRAIIVRRIIVWACAAFLAYATWAIATAPPADQYAFTAQPQDVMVQLMVPAAPAETTIADLEAAHFKPTAKPQLAMDITAPLWDAAFEQVYGPITDAKKHKDVAYDLQPVENIVFGALGHDIELGRYKAYETAAHPGFTVYVNVETGRVMLATQAMGSRGRMAYVSAENIGPAMLLSSVPEQLKHGGAKVKPGFTFQVTTALGLKRDRTEATAIVGKFADM